jgi:hypothetical protein
VLGGIHWKGGAVTEKAVHLHYKDEPVNAAKGIIATYCENKMKHTLWQNVKLLNITAGCVYSFN